MVNSKSVQQERQMPKSISSSRKSSSVGKSATSVRSNQENQSTELTPSEMTNEQRMKVYAKKLFADRDYLGYFVYRNPPKAEKNEANRQQQQQQQQSGLV